MWHFEKFLILGALGADTPHYPMLLEHWAFWGLLDGSCGMGRARVVTTGQIPTQHFTPLLIF